MPFVYREREGIGLYEVPAWRGAEAVFTTRVGGHSRGVYAGLNLGSGGGDDPEAVAENRRLLSGALGVDAGMLKTINQVHGSDVHVVRDAGEPTPPGGYDAVVTALPGPALSVLTADCVPILLYDPVRRVVGAVHAGWAGTVAGIAESAVGAMTREYGTEPADVLAAVGPSIGPCCYEVDEKVLAPLKTAMGDTPGLLSPSKGARKLLDLWKANLMVLGRAGVKEDNVSLMRMCTACNPERFYSHRQSGGRAGRMMAVVRLTEGR